MILKDHFMNPKTCVHGAGYDHFKAFFGPSRISETGAPRAPLKCILTDDSSTPGCVPSAECSLVVGLSALLPEEGGMEKKISINFEE